MVNFGVHCKLIPCSKWRHVLLWGPNGLRVLIRQCTLSINNHQCQHQHHRLHYITKSISVLPFFSHIFSTKHFISLPLSLTEEEEGSAMDAAAPQLVSCRIDTICRRTLPSRLPFPKTTVRARKRPGKVLAVATEPKPTNSSPKKSVNGSARSPSAPKPLNGVSTVITRPFFELKRIAVFLFFFFFFCFLIELVYDYSVPLC